MNCIHCGTDDRTPSEPCPRCGGPYPKPDEAGTGGEAGARAEHPVSDIIVWAGVGLILPLLLVGLLVWR